ncbi:hypothetical protein TRFO_00907 [Tritrichomonas foetus]|uniref:FERM domain-containing protein n=1 Tax=Tritrichomonas foetus TaxID=1144522 RepID=A0A1J4L2F8_9EUKA|nr:hypothetical protein TRFO_00907 [Tritrichomonas foetus]|eukprot:OHT17635.1 hypothetical protein TRFO_00907 [Tritrichomonas foetus]
MSELKIRLSVPFSNEESVSVTVQSNSTIASILSRAVHIFNCLGDLSKFDILILINDGTYQFTTPEDTIGMYSLSEKPEVIFVPKEFEIEITPEMDNTPIKMTVKDDDTVQTILERVCKQSGSLKPKHYVITHENVVLIKSLSIVEQRPQAQKLGFIEASSEKVQLNFMELYLRGPVFLSFSDALQLSAYLLQATQGPFRCFKGSASSLVKFLPMCFHDTEHAGDELQVHWSFLTDCTRDEATRKFTEFVQRLPLFNCTSFSCNKLKKDETLPKEFELIFTEKRTFILDKIKFKTRLSIPYDCIISITRNEDEIEIVYTKDGTSEITVKFETNTARSLFTKCVELVDSPEAANNLEFNDDTIKHSFHELSQIKDDPTRMKLFNTDFLYKFLNADETDDRISYVEVMQALAIRAESCSFHLSVLLSKVTVNNAKLFKKEITEYYIRLMAYLTYMTYDHRPFDAAYSLAKCIYNLENEVEKANSIIQEVVRLLGLVTRMFVPISHNPIYVISQNAKAHVLGHLLSIIEFPYATPSQAQEPFDELRTQFLDNALTMKDNIKKYLFSVGKVEIKKELQKTLDKVFKLHLSTLSLMPLIVESTEIGELNPSVIMHQDSCNMTMTTIVEFSRLLWEDRKQLTDDQLSSFLSTAAELARQLLIEGPKYGSHITSIQSFLQVVDLNLNGLSSLLRMHFFSFKVYAQRLVAKYEIVPSLDFPHMMFKLIQCASILVVAQPLVLHQFVPSIIDQLNYLGRDVYSRIINDLPVFDLLPDESGNTNNAVLRCIALERIPQAPEDKAAPELLQRILPILALQYNIGRLVSEWVPNLVHIALWVTSFVEAVSNSALNVSGVKLEKFEEFATWLPHHDCKPLEAALETPDLKPEVSAILKACANPSFYFKLPELNDHAQIKITLEAISAISQLAFNAVSLSLNHNLWHAMSSLPQMIISAQLFLDALYEVMLQPTYFTIPPLYLEHKANLESIFEGSKTFFETGKVNNVYISNVMLFNAHIKFVKPVCIATDLTSLYPLETMELPDKLDSSIKVDRRQDMADMICEYRTLKNELVECLLLREKENIQLVVVRIQKVISTIAALENHVHPGNELVSRIESGFSAFIKQLPVVYTYKLSVMSLREILDTVDVPIDQSIDDVAYKLYERVEPEALNDLSEKIDHTTFEPSERAEFAKNFSEALKPLLGQIEDIEELQLLHELLLLLQDNQISEMKYLVSTLSESKSEPLMKVIKDSSYAKYVRKIEKCLELIAFDEELPVWYKDGVKSLVESLKAQNSNENDIKIVEALTDVDNDNVHRCIEKAFNINQLEQLKGLFEVSKFVQKHTPNIEADLKNFEDLINNATDYKGCSLLYKDTIRQVIHCFRDEFCLQNWDSSIFGSICTACLSPIHQQFSSESVAKALISARRKLRSIRLLYTTAHSRFITECDNLLTNAERALREYFSGSRKAHIAIIDKQKDIVVNVEKEFAKLPESNLRIFLSHLIHNVLLNLETVDSFNANKFASDIQPIESSFTQNRLRANQINAVIKWIQSINRDVLPVDYDHLIIILKKLLETLSTISDDQLFEYDQDVLMDIAMKLSEALGKLTAVRYSLILVKDMHRLYSVKEPLMSFVSSVVRTLEAYAEEIHTFPIQKHPILGLIESVPKMCEKLETLIEASFMLQNTKRHGEEAIQAINEFYESCPDDVKENMQVAIQAPIKAIESINSE